MNRLAATALVLVLGTTEGQVLRSTGHVPAAVGAASRIVWVAADDRLRETSPHCDLKPADEWQCDLPPDTRGVVAIVGDAGVAAVAVGVDASDAEAEVVGGWGRLVRVGAGGAAPEDLPGLQCTAWIPGRSAVRRLARRFVAVPDPTVQVLRVSDSAFWITGQKADPDGFIRIDGSAIASARIRTELLAEGPPEVPFFVAATTPLSIEGRVRTRDGGDVEAADVELLEPLPSAEAADLAAEASPQLIRRARTQTDENGFFAFERLEPGRYQIAASHQTLGRGGVSVKAASELVVIRLIPPARATGRVLRRGLPVVGARVRFVPAAAVWTTSVDATAHLVQEVSTDAAGAFVLTLPPEHAGDLQAIGPDGALARVPLSAPRDTGEFVIGDIRLPDPRGLTVRLLDAAKCDMYAIGPVGSLGMTTVRATSSSNVYWFELPEAGGWALGADCGPRAFSVDPPGVTIPPEGPDVSIDVILREPADHS